MEINDFNCVCRDNTSVDDVKEALFVVNRCKGGAYLGNDLIQAKESKECQGLKCTSNDEDSSVSEDEKMKTYRKTQSYLSPNAKKLQDMVQASVEKASNDNS